MLSESRSSKPYVNPDPHPEPLPFLDLTPETDELWDELNAAFQRVLKSGQFVMGPEVAAFEEEAARYLGAAHAVGVNSGTDALLIGLRALGVGPGDEVITTPFSFFATAEAISNVGAVPVFADVDPRSFNLDPAKVAEKITPRTKAIMPVHLYGLPAAMDELIEIVEAHELLMLEDCAQSFGARVKGRATGTLGHAGAYSFYPTKNLGAYGDGGLLVTNDDATAKMARMLRDHGTLRRYHNEMLGYNSRLDALQAALLRVKLPYVDTWNEARRRVAGCYNRLLASLDNVVTPELTEGHIFHQYTVRLLDVDRDAVQTKLKDLGVSTMVYYPVPQDRLPVYRGQHPRNPVSDRLSAEVLSLPIWPTMTLDAQQRVAQALETALRS